MKKMYTRKLIGISIALTFLVLGVTGIIMYVIPHNKIVSSVHTLFGIVFIGVAIFHLKNNFRALKTYSTENKSKSSFSFSKPFYIVAVISSLVLVGQLYALPPMDLIYQWGNSLRNSQQGKSATINEYEFIELPEAVGETGIVIEAKKGSSFKFPLFAVWIENLEGDYLQTLYVSQVLLPVYSNMVKRKRINGCLQFYIVRKRYPAGHIKVHIKKLLWKLKSRIKN